MKTRPHPYVRRFFSVAAVGILAVALTSCTGRGGGQLPPDSVMGFTGPASFGFSVSCEDNSTTLNSPPAQPRIQLSYTDHGTNPLGSSFSIHGVVDEMNPILQSQICIAVNSPPEPYPPNQLIFLGRYRLTSSAPAGFDSTCVEREITTTSCRFEVIVQDNDTSRGPSKGDSFQIRLSGSTGPVDLGSSQLPSAFYMRGGTLSSGNLTVD